MAITTRSKRPAAASGSQQAGSPLELARHAALDAHGPPSRRRILPSGAGSANTGGQSMVEIVSKHHRVLDAANELMWRTWLVEEAPELGLGLRLLLC